MNGVNGYTVISSFVVFVSSVCKMINWKTSGRRAHLCMSFLYLVKPSLTGTRLVTDWGQMQNESGHSITCSCTLHLVH